MDSAERSGSTVFLFLAKKELIHKDAQKCQDQGGHGIDQQIEIFPRFVGRELSNKPIGEEEKTKKKDIIDPTSVFQITHEIAFITTKY